MKDNNNNNKQKVVIFERSNNPLMRINESKDELGGKAKYIFEGPCAFFGSKNQNNRYYDKKEYLDHFEYLLPQIKQKMLAGSLDHPEEDDDDDEKDIFTPKMKDLSHLILDLRYREDLDEVWIKIQLIDTHWGRDAMACADAGMPIFISSRASGYIEDDGHVILDTIHTYDVVYRPGFGNAKLNPVLESYAGEYSSFKVFECINNKNMVNNKEKDKETEKMEALLRSINEGLQKIERLSNPVFEAEINGKACIGGVTSNGKDFFWTVGLDGKVTLSLKDGEAYIPVLIDVPVSMKSIVNAFITSYKQLDGSDFLKDIKDNFQGNPFFESLEDGKMMTSQELIECKTKDSEQFMFALMNYLCNSDDDTNVKLDTANSYVMEVYKEDMLESDEVTGKSYTDEEKKNILEAFIDANKQYIKENKGNRIMECIKLAKKDYKYIKESLESKKINESDEAICIVNDFIGCENKPLEQKVDLICSLNKMFPEDCNYEILQDQNETIDEFCANVSSSDLDNLKSSFISYTQKNLERYNVVSKRVNNVVDYLDLLAMSINQSADAAEMTISNMKSENASLLDRVTMMEKKFERMKEYCNTMSVTMNNLIEYSSINATRINTLSDYSETIAQTLNENVDSQNAKIAKVSESVSGKIAKQKRVNENLDEKLDKAIAKVINGRQSNKFVNENANKEIKAFNSDGTLKIPVRYQRAFESLEQSKKNEAYSLFLHRNPKSHEEISSIWESLKLKSERFFENKQPVKLTQNGVFGYDKKDIENLLSIK